MSRIFISYVEEDSYVANAIAKYLNAAGFGTWLYERDAVPGQSYLTQTSDEISSALAVILVISSTTLASHQITKEVVRAHETNKPLLPVLIGLEHADLPSAKPEWSQAIGASVSIKWSLEDSDQVLSRLMMGLKAIVGGQHRVPFLQTAKTPDIISERGAFSHRFMRKMRFFRNAVSKRETPLRVAFSALLRISQGGRYLLVRNLHRPESFAPFGGVYKYFDAANEFLNSIGFRPQTVGPGRDMVNDMRGFVDLKYGIRLINWFQGGKGRESARDCLSRELEEELDEIGLSSIAAVSNATIRFVRRVEEGPEPVPGQDYLQFRFFDVYELQRASEHESFFDQLFRFANESDDLIVASAQEVVSGRAHLGPLIGHHTAYLLGRRRYRPELPVFSDY